MTPEEDAFKKTVMTHLCPIDALTCEFGLSGFSDDKERLNQTTVNLRDMVNQTVMKEIVTELGLTYEEPTNITLVTKEALDALTSQSIKNTLTSLLPSIPGLGRKHYSVFYYFINFLGYLLSFLG
uniref:Peptidase_M13_N domain-containing protein n=1 Tax=Strongyloides papillosus TaxID=174720 RepID=A0A0N5CAM8_STREA